MNDSDTFEKAYQSFIAEDRYALNEAQQQALKTAYRKACIEKRVDFAILILSPMN